MNEARPLKAADANSSRGGRGRRLSTGARCRAWTIARGETGVLTDAPHGPRWPGRRAGPTGRRFTIPGRAVFFRLLSPVTP